MESIRLSKLTAIAYYLKELKKKNLVAPSIALPYPRVPITDEKMLKHCRNLALQNERLLKIKEEIRHLTAQQIPLCAKTLECNEARLDKKVIDLERNYLISQDVERSPEESLPKRKIDESITMANLIAKNFYLNELQKLHLVTPSIALPFPKHPITEEKWLIHSAHCKIQLKRIASLKVEIATLKAKKVAPCRKTLSMTKRRLWKKAMFLRKKFQPTANRKKSKRSTQSDGRKNKKSKERYLARQFRKKLKDYENRVDGRNVYNLSSIDLPVVDLYALEYGHGFVVTPNNRMKEEEFLVLEGFRFLDRLGKADERLSKAEKQAAEEDLTAASSQRLVLSENEHFRSDLFVKNDFVPDDLQIRQPAEIELTCSESKIVKKEFEELNNKIISSLSTNKRRKCNIPKVIRSSILKLKKLVIDKVIDIRKVDKGQAILITDYSQRIAAEKENISKIASLCEVQASNWKENKSYVEDTMKKLYNERFVTKNELAAVTGLLAGGSTGKLKDKNGIKFTHLLSQKELFAEQRTPYVYPFWKVHKLPLKSLLEVKPDEVQKSIPCRLVVGMSNCQMSRLQRWLENFLTPLSKLYGDFEYIKDSTDFLVKLEMMKSVAEEEAWNVENMIIFTIDVQALYPSVRIEDVEKSLRSCFDKCTNWDETVKDTLIELVSYTMKNQQILWQGQYYMLCQGITTGGKHSVPLANILLSFIIISAFDQDQNFLDIFNSSVKLWSRFIDDCFGIFMGSIEEFEIFF